MDPVAKLVSAQLRKQAAGPHLDPDQLTALAENVLSRGERDEALAHLSQCTECRQIFYLSAPEAAEAQKILALKPRPRFAWRWGALGATVAVLIAAFVVRDQVARGPRSLKSAQSSARSNEAYTRDKIAEEKPPAELDQMHASESRPSAAAPASPKARPEAKHMTAKPQVGLTFEPSGQVRVSGRTDLDKRDMAVGGIAKQGQVAQQANNTVLLNNSPAAQSLGPSQAAGGGVKDQNQLRSYTAPALFAPKAVPAGNLGGPAGGNLGGVVLDSSGAVVANAKISTIGPSGTKTAVSDGEGRFSFDQLPPGTYAVKAEANGFKVAENKQVAVVADKGSTVQLKLEPGASAETVEVSAAAPALQQTTAEQATLDSNTVAALPQSQREQTAQEEISTSRKKKPLANARAVAATGAGVTSPFQWTLSPDGGVRRSGDGGKSWASIPVAPGTVFRALSSLGANVWVGGDAGALYHSSDSGLHWAKVIPSAAGLSLRGDIVHIEFATQSGLLRTSTGETWTTVDGGQTWARK